MSDNEEVIGARFEIDISNLKNGITQANRYIKESQSEFKAAAAGMDDWRNSEEGLEAKLKSLNTVSDMQAKKVDALEQAYQQVSAEMGETSAEAMNLSIRLNNAKADFNKTQKEIRDTDGALNDFRTGADEAGDAAQQAGADADKAGDNFGGFSDSIVDTVKQLGGIAIAGMGISSIAEYIESASGAQSRLNAVLGVSGDEADGFNDALNNIYSNNYGESFDDIAESATEVAKVLGNDISPETLESVTTQALILRDTFGSDVNESVKAADAMMDNFGMTSEEAFDMLAKGAQSGLDKNGEMFDSFTEYSQYFSDLGLSADDMFNGMKAGTDQFLMGADKSMDAWKEFGIRVIDGSASTAGAMSAIGLDADEMAAKFAAGGETSKEATQQTVDALMAMDDPVAQSQAGIALFGTQWEDMGESGMQAMFDLMGTATDTAGTMDEINEVRYDDIGNSLGAIGRAIQDSVLSPLVDTLTPAISDFSQSIIPEIQNGAQWFIDNLPTIAPLLAAIGGGFAAFQVASIISSAVAAVNAFKTAQEAATVAQAAFNLVMNANPIMIIVTIIGALVAALIVLWNTNEDFRNAVTSAWESVSSVVGGVVDAIVGFFTETVPEALSNLGDWFSKLPDNIMNALSTALSNIASWAGEVGAKALEVGQNFLNNVINFFTQLPGNIWNLLVMVITSIGQWELQMIQWAIQTGQNFLTNIVNFFSQLPGRIMSFLSTVISNVISFVGNMANNARNAGSQFLNNVVSFVTQLPGRIAGFLGSVIGNVGGFVGNMASSAIQAGSQFLSNIVSNIQQAPGRIMDILSQIPGKVAGFAGDMAGAAGDMIQGLINGIGNGAGAVVEKIKEICSGALDAVKDFFGIHSPSRVMMQMGQYIDEGMEIGIGKGIKDVSAMAEKLSEAATPDISPVAFTTSSQGGANVNGGTTSGSRLPKGAKGVSVVQNFYSPEAITAKDAYRQGVKLKQTLATGV